MNIKYVNDGVKMTKPDLNIHRITTAKDAQKASNTEQRMNIALWQAATEQNQTEILKQLSLGANVNIRGPNNKTILIHFVEQACDDLALIILNAGASLDPQDHNGDTALIHAVRNSSLKVTEQLIDKGAGILFENKHGEKAFDIALRQKNPALAALFEKALKDMIQRIPQEHLTWRHPISPRERDPHGDTILTWAARHGQENVIRALIRSGTDLCKTNSEGLTAYEIAEQAGYNRIARLLSQESGDKKI
jgi:ankyrin repeat protein